MKITELLNQSKISNSNLNEVLSAHPKQFIFSDLEIPVCEIKYSYTTQRDNKKENVKYMFKSEEEWDGVENQFNIYIDEFNATYPNRKISNVEILEINYLGELLLEFE